MIFDFFRRWVVRDGNTVVQDYGSITEPQLSATVVGTPRSGPEVVTLAAGASLKIWDYTADGEFAYLLIEASGLCYVAEKVDAPVSSSDKTAAGTSVNYPKTAISCNAPLVLQGMTVPVNASASNYAASAFYANTTAGRRYEVWLKNPSATAAITVRFLRTL